MIHCVAVTTHTMSLIVLAILAVWGYAHGVHRYRNLKEALKLEEPPLHFGRMSNYPQAFWYFFFFVMVLSAMCFKRELWEK